MTKILKLLEFILAQELAMKPEVPTTNLEEVPMADLEEGPLVRVLDNGLIVRQARDLETGLGARGVQDSTAGPEVLDSDVPEVRGALDSIQELGFLGSDVREVRD